MPFSFSTIDHHKSRKAYKQNKPLIPKLLKSLCNRDAIQKERLRYWNDPEYNAGSRQRTSHQGIFEQKGCRGEEIYTHPHFLKYLRYFLFGADLPDEVIEAFMAKLEKKNINAESFSSDDYPEVWKIARKAARQVIRQYGSNKKLVAEEFLKLCLDMGFDISDARSVRDAIMKVR